MLLALASLVAVHAGLEPLTLNVDGVTREALVYRPSGAGPAPLVLAFHGHGGGSRQASRSFQIEKYWPEAMVIYPQGLPTKSFYDKAGGKNGWQGMPDADGARDVHFTAALLNWAKSNAAIQSDRVYAMGHSNGAIFLYVLWQTMPDAFRAFAPIKGSGNVSMRNIKTPKPLFIAMGKTDPLVKPAWMEATIRFVRKLDGLQDVAGVQDGDVTTYSKPGCVDLVTLVKDEGHVYGQETSDLLVRFFKSH